MAAMIRPSREDIIREIQRCAAANGGMPLGKRGFEAETGIRETDWLGRYWARWGDAVQQAGFQPNEIQQRIYDDEGLVRLLAALTRKLGHFPTVPEMLLHRQSDSDFPSEKTFRRLGGRAAKVALVLEFSKANAEFADVYEVCLPLAGANALTADPAAGSGAVGVVYLMRSGKHHKIGRTTSIGRRSYEIGLQLPEKQKLVHYVETDDPVGIERYWHQRFADRRLNGEWFALSPADIAAFKLRRRFM
jgi:Meiotically up-regulated gene 113